MLASLGADSPTARTHRALAASHARLVTRDAATIRTQIAISQIAAPTGDERQRGELGASRLRSLGFADARIAPAGNVAGLMPHPERAAEAVLGSEDGAGIIRSLVDSAAKAAAGAGPVAVGAR